MCGVQHLVDGQPDRLLERETHHRLRGPVEEQDVALRVQEDHAVFQLVYHSLQVGLLAERGQPVGLQLPPEVRELCRQLLDWSINERLLPAQPFTRVFQRVGCREEELD